VLISLIFIVPLLVWGNRWPWLASIPFALIVVATVRSEWLRVRALNEDKNVQIMEATFLPEGAFDQEDWFCPVHEDNWGNITASDSPKICNIVSIDDYGTPDTVADEKLTAVA